MPEEPSALIRKFTVCECWSYFSVIHSCHSSGLRTSLCGLAERFKGDCTATVCTELAGNHSTVRMTIFNFKMSAPLTHPHSQSWRKVLRIHVRCWRQNKVRSERNFFPQNLLLNFTQMPT